jgi:hypothetical protein
MIEHQLRVVAEWQRRLQAARDKLLGPGGGNRASRAEIESEIASLEQRLGAERAKLRFHDPSQQPELLAPWREKHAALIAEAKDLLRRYAEAYSALLAHDDAFFNATTLNPVLLGTVDVPDLRGRIP